MSNLQHEKENPELQGTSKIPKIQTLHVNYMLLPIIWLASLPTLQLENRVFGNSLLLFCTWFLPQYVDSFSDCVSRQKSSFLFSCMHVHTCVNIYTYVFLTLFSKTSASFGYLKCSSIIDEGIRESI